MAEFNRVLYAVDTGLPPEEFERLCLDMLFREGYRHILPGGRSNDLGRDAEIRFWSGSSAEFSNIVFQFSLQENWERKLKIDAAKIAKECAGVASMVFVTSRNVTVAKREKLRADFRAENGWDLTILEREWLRLRLEQRDQDLVKKYFDLELPTSIAHTTALVQGTDFRDGVAQELFRHSSPELVRATLIEATRKEPQIADNWLQLARLEDYLHNYEGALKALNRCLQLETSDRTAQLNLRLFKGAILAEQAITTNSRPLLIEAKDILSWAVERVKRPLDHYNYANVLSALGELQEAEKHYRTCLEREPSFAQAWTNLANLLLKLDQADEAISCFDKALAIDPGLIEAHFSKARANLLIGKPNESVTGFEAGLRLMSEPDRKGRLILYWYAQSLAAANRLEDALRQVDIELEQKPGNRYLLDLKRDILARLWREDARHEPTALEFMRFRMRIARQDYFALGDLIRLSVKRGLDDEAWTALQTNVNCAEFLIQSISEKCGITLMDFAEGFANVRLYANFRKIHPLEHHCVTLTDNGVIPNLNAFACLDHSLVAPFARMVEQVRMFSKGDKSINLNSAFFAATKTASRLFAYFGPHWLAKEVPSEQQQRIDLLALGMLLGFEIVVREMSRQFGYLGGRFNLKKEEMSAAEKCNWRELQKDFAVDLLERVMTEWKMIQQ